MLTSMLRHRRSVGLAVAAFAAMLPAAGQATVRHRLPPKATTKDTAKDAAKDAAKPDAAAAADPSKPTLVGNYGDWGAYATAGKTKICYALGKPKDRSPSSLKKDQAYVFISNRPAEGVKNEISVIMGVPLKEGAAEAKAEVGTTTFDLIAKGQNAWVKNAADETRFIDAMKKGGKLIVKGTLTRGGTATDSYSLAGLAQALDRVVKDCR